MNKEECLKALSYFYEEVSIDEYNTKLDDKNYQILEKLIEEHFEMVEKYEMQYLDDIKNPLEPLKLKSALDSEIFKYQYRLENKPSEINILDYTIMYALKHCLEEQIKKQVEE